MKFIWTSFGIFILMWPMAWLLNHYNVSNDLKMMIALPLIIIDLILFCLGIIVCEKAQQRKSIDRQNFIDNMNA